MAALAIGIGQNKEGLIMNNLLEESACVVIDIQERLAPAISDNTRTIANTVKFVKGLHILQVPVVVVRQYPKGLGDVVPELRQALGQYTPLDKTTFSAYREPAVVEHLRALGKKNLFVVGMEAHVCVLQSVVDFINAGYKTHVLADCVSSRNPYDKEIALRRAEKEGAYLTTCETVLFELLERAGGSIFKAISDLVK